MRCAPAAEAKGRRESIRRRDRKASGANAGERLALPPSRTAVPGTVRGIPIKGTGAPPLRL